MISIHLRRTGAKKDPHYRVVVADSRDARDGSFIEVLGHYHPRFTPARVTLDLEGIKSWVAKGAQPSDTVKSLVRQVESGKLDALPDLPKLEPMPMNSLDADDVAPGEATPEVRPDAEVESSAPEADTSGATEASADSAEAETADFPVPAEATVATPDTADATADEQEKKEE